MYVKRLFLIIIFAMSLMGCSNSMDKNTTKILVINNIEKQKTHRIEQIQINKLCLIDKQTEVSCRCIELVILKLIPEMMTCELSTFCNIPGIL